MGTIYPESIVNTRIGIPDISGTGTYVGIAYRGSRAITDRQLLNGAREIIAERRQHSSLFQLPGGLAMMLFHPNINYNDGGIYRETDLRFTAADAYSKQLTTAYYQVTTGNYPVVSALTDVVKCKIIQGSKYFQFWPVSLKWHTYDGLFADYAQALVYEAPVTVTVSTGIIQSELLRYQGPFGTTTELDYIPNTSFFTKQLKLYQKNYPSVLIRGKSPDLEFKFGFSTNYLIYADGLPFGLLAGDESTTTSDSIELRDGTTVISKLSRPYAADANGQRVTCDYRLDKINGVYSITVLVPYAWWVNAVYPIIIDPESTFEATPQSGALANGGSWATKDEFGGYVYDQGAVGRVNGDSTFRTFIIFDTTGAPDLSELLFISGRIYGVTTGSVYGSIPAPTEVGIVWTDFPDDWKENSSLFADVWESAKAVTKDSASYQGIPSEGSYSIAFADGYFVNILGLTKMALIIRADYENDATEPDTNETEIALSTIENKTFLELVWTPDYIIPDSAHFDSDTTFGEFRVYKQEIAPDSITSTLDIGEPRIAVIRIDAIESTTTIGEPTVGTRIITPDSIESTVAFGEFIFNLLTVTSNVVIGSVSYGIPDQSVMHTLVIDDGAHVAYPFTVTEVVTITDAAYAVQWVQEGLIIGETLVDFNNPLGPDAVAVTQTITFTVEKTLTVTSTVTVNSDIVDWKD